MAFHQYNKQQYNIAQYNADTTFWVKACTESVASADARIDSPNKLLAETVTNTDARTMLATRAFADFLFLVDVVTKSILNKGLVETIRVNDWLQIERKSQNNSNGWGNS